MSEDQSIKDAPLSSKSTTSMITDAANFLHFAFGNTHQHFANNVFEEVGANHNLDHVKESVHPRLVIFDIDATLLVADRVLDKVAVNPDQYPCLEPAPSFYASDIELSISMHSIYRQRTSELFADLLDDGAEIGFLTHGLYDKQDFIPYIERLYGMRDGTLKDSVFWNRKDCGKDYNATGKGVTLLSLQDQGYIGTTDQVTLVDDNLEHVTNARLCGFDAIHARGLFVYLLDDSKEYGVISEDGYLQELRDLCMGKNTLSCRMGP